MKIWITRHGETNLNKQEVMQGLTDEPLNDTGRSQARAARGNMADMTFDAVYASPLQRAIETASIIGNVPKEDIIIDSRLIEVDFGKYEKCSFHKMGPWFSMFWAFPEVFPAPPTVETTRSMIKRSHSFLKELESKDYENVLVVCHGGIIRALCGYMEDTKTGLKWRPRPLNCEIRIYESSNGIHRSLS